jgi:hypothetical protein
MFRAVVRELPSAVFRIAALAEKHWRAETPDELIRTLFSEAAAAARKIPDAARLLSDVLPGRVRTATRRAYDAAQPWAQPNPNDPTGLAPTVLNVPAAEVDEFVDIVVSRYLRTLRTHWRQAALDAWRQNALDVVSDAAFGRIFRDTMLCRFLVEELGDRDRLDVTPQASLSPQSRYLKLDFSELSRLDTFDGIHVAATETLLEEAPGSATLTPRVIRINGLSLRPEDGDAWELAKYFVLQGASLSVLMGLHPTVHFPMDAINALTKTLIPLDHPVRRALEPHFYLQLPLNYAVLHIKRSYAYNDQREMYTSLPGTYRGFMRLASAYHTGVAGKSGYPAYRFPLTAPALPFGYGTYLNGWFDHILSFTSEVAAHVAPGDPAVRLWARHLSMHLPGFPDEAGIFAGDALARSLASLILDVAVVHSADHQSYADIPIRSIPLRLRVAPFKTRSVAPLDRAALVRREDLFRHLMSHEMFFKPTTVRRFDQVQYSFAEEALRKAARAFLRGLPTVDAALSGSGYARLDQLACSIQY